MARVVVEPRCRQSLSAALWAGSTGEVHKPAHQVTQNQYNLNFMMALVSSSLLLLLALSCAAPAEKAAVQTRQVLPAEAKEDLVAEKEDLKPAASHWGGWGYGGYGGYGYGSHLGYGGYGGYGGWPYYGSSYWGYPSWSYGYGWPYYGGFGYGHGYWW